MFCSIFNTIPPFFSVALSIQIHYGATVHAKYIHYRKQTFVSPRSLVAQSYITYIQKQNQCMHVFDLSCHTTTGVELRRKNVQEMP